MIAARCCARGLSNVLMLARSAGGHHRLLRDVETRHHDLALCTEHDVGGLGIVDDVGLGRR